MKITNWTIVIIITIEAITPGCRTKKQITTTKINSSIETEDKEKESKIDTIKSIDTTSLKQIVKNNNYKRTTIKETIYNTKDTTEKGIKSEKTIIIEEIQSEEKTINKERKKEHTEQKIKTKEKTNTKKKIKESVKTETIIKKGNSIKQLALATLIFTIVITLIIKKIKNK